jgi:hypothetical protein
LFGLTYPVAVFAVHGVRPTDSGDSMFPQADIDAHTATFRATRYAIVDLSQFIDTHYSDSEVSLPNMMVDHALTALFDAQDQQCDSRDWITLADGVEYRAETVTTRIDVATVSDSDRADRQGNGDAVGSSYSVVFLVPSVADKPTVECWCRHANDHYALDFCQTVQPLQTGQRHTTSVTNGDDIQRVLGRLFD